MEYIAVVNEMLLMMVYMYILWVCKISCQDDCFSVIYTSELTCSALPAECYIASTSFFVGGPETTRKCLCRIGERKAIPSTASGFSPSDSHCVCFSLPITCTYTLPPSPPPHLLPGWLSWDVAHRWVLYVWGWVTMETTSLEELEGKDHACPPLRKWLREDNCRQST